MNKMLYFSSVLLFTLAGTAAQAGVLNVCAAPDNLPYSNRAGAGYENKIAALIAKDMGDSLHYIWWTQRNEFSPKDALQERCDVWLGMVQGDADLATTHPYYRSSYMFVTRASRHLHVSSLNDPALRHLKIGVRLLGLTAQGTPPYYALADRGITRNVKGFGMLDAEHDYGHPNPPDAVLNAVENGSIDVAIVWGPLAGYYAGKFPGTLALTPVQPVLANNVWPMTFGISAAVHKGDAAMLQRMNDELARNQNSIDAILASYHVPVLPPAIASHAQSSPATPAAPPPAAPHHWFVPPANWALLAALLAALGTLGMSARRHRRRLL